MHNFIEQQSLGLTVLKQLCKYSNTGILFLWIAKFTKMLLFKCMSLLDYEFSLFSLLQILTMM